VDVNAIDVEEDEGMEEDVEGRVHAGVAADAVDVEEDEGVAGVNGVEPDIDLFAIPWTKTLIQTWRRQGRRRRARARGPRSTCDGIG
jgi:hypothetical protein